MVRARTQRCRPRLTGVSTPGGLREVRYPTVNDIERGTPEIPDAAQLPDGSVAGVNQQREGQTMREQDRIERAREIYELAMF